MTYTRAHYWLALKFVPRLSVDKKRTLVERVGLKALFTHAFDVMSTLSFTEKQQQAIINPDWQKINNIIDTCNSMNINIICFDDQTYPEALKEIYDPPLILFAIGDVSVISSPQLAVVGSRSASINGREAADYFAKELSLYLTITSGLALGIDAAAHQGALKGSGRTVAVVATGLDKIYPARNKSLAKEIINHGGVIVSEFLPGTPPRAGNFPRRNRIISGLSLGVLIVEAAIKSGSLITARCALEQNREVFAIPSTLNNPLAKGCHHLIKQGAKLIDCVADILTELKISEQSTHIKCVTEKTIKSDEQGLLNDPLLASVGYEITPVDTVISRSKLPTDEVLTRLTMLELKGLVSAVPGGYLRLNRG